MNSKDCLDIIRQNLKGMVGDPPKVTVAQDVAESVMNALESQGAVNPGYEVEVTRNPHSPDVLDIRVQLRPVSMWPYDRVVPTEGWCWNCGTEFLNHGGYCECGGAVRNRPRNSVDAMGESVVEGD